MARQKKGVFDQIPPTQNGHFVLYFYAAVYRLINHIHQLSEVGGQKLKKIFKQYPFLAKYHAEIQRYIPENIHWTDTDKWFQQEIHIWEDKCNTSLPLLTLVKNEEIGYNSCLAFMITGIVEEDSRFGVVFAALQAPLDLRRPTLELVGRIIALNGTSLSNENSWSICNPLIRNGFVDVLNRESARSEWVLRVPSLLWDAARGQIPPHAEPWFSRYKTEVEPDELIYPPDFIEQLKNIPSLLDNGKVQNLILRSNYGSDPLEVLGVLAAKSNSELIVVDVQTYKETGQLRLLGPFCTMTHSLPVLSYNLVPGETITPPILEGYNGPIFFSLGLEGGIDSRKIENSLTVKLPAPDWTLRKRYWQQALDGREIEDLDTIAETFHISGSHIKQVAAIAVANAGLNKREVVSLEDVQQASRSLNRQQLDTLANQLQTRGSWYDLVATKTTTDKLKELQQRCRHREQILGHLGIAFRNNANRGVRALFSGTSGTGKTLAATLLAAEIKKDIFRVDLAAIINKYIGETEKNLHRVLSRAEALDVILLLDEGDTLLGSRTEQKSANDRYANMETNYLLQRLENYQGIVLVTTNLGENIDQAFQRRMDVVVPFFPPLEEERLRIMEIHLPEKHQVDEEYLEQVALRCPLTGAQIRNAAFHATLLAVNQGVPVDRHHLDQALRSEFRKAGGTFPLANDHTDDCDRDGGMGVFIQALRYQ